VSGNGVTTSGGKQTADRADRFEYEVVPFASQLYLHALGLTTNRSDAEDLVQETLTRAYAAAGGVPALPAPSAEAEVLERLAESDVLRALRELPEEFKVASSPTTRG
jgi:hypothetical protein